MKVIQNVKHLIIFIVFSFIQLSFITQEIVCMDAVFANDAHYRSGSWEKQPAMSTATHPLHQKLAYSVVCAHELCEDPSSNIAAFGFSIHKADGTILNSVEFPLLFSSGKLAPTLSSSLNVCTIDERFSKTLDILSPRQQLIEYINFICKHLGLMFEGLDKALLSLADGNTIDRSPSIPTLRLDPGELDVPLGYVKHCEQCFIFEMHRNPDLLNRAFRKLQDGITETPSFISLNILTYNDMCQRCFAACDKYLPDIQNAARAIFPAIDFRVYISSFKPFEINIAKSISAGFTRGMKKYGDYESFAQTPIFTGTDSAATKNRMQIFQFFNPWMLDAQREIERKKHIRAVIQALSDNIPFIYEDLPAVLLIRKNTKQLSLPNAQTAIKALHSIKGTASPKILEEMEKVQPLIEAAHKALTDPLVLQQQELNTQLTALRQGLQLDKKIVDSQPDTLTPSPKPVASAKTVIHKWLSENSGQRTGGNEERMIADFRSFLQSIATEELMKLKAEDASLFDSEWRQFRKTGLFLSDTSLSNILEEEKTKR